MKGGNGKCHIQKQFLYCKTFLLKGVNGKFLFLDKKISLVRRRSSRSSHISGCEGIMRYY